VNYASERNDFPVKLAPRNGTGGIEMINRVLALVVMWATVLLLTDVARAQRGEAFKGRLSTVPVDATTAPTTTGSGSLVALLADNRDGNKLTINGKFEGMNSPATVAHVHRAPRGLRGPSVFDLVVTKATGGIVEGNLTLTAAQVEELKKGWYYVQIHTEKNPEGQLRGWLLK
jgi:hypothetical protein